MINNSNFLITIFFIIGVATRIIPHPPNLTALGAVALFGGALYFDKKISLIIPIIILAISDFILGFQMNISVYFSFLLIVFLGFNLRNKLSFKNIIELEEGDLVILDNKTHEEIDIEMIDKILYTASIGLSNGKYACKINNVIIGGK